jgi:hypothetical protein
MSVEEITIIIEATLGSENDTITKVFYGNKTYYGFFSPADDYELLKRTNRWRFTPNESSQMYVDGKSRKTDTDKKFSLILNGDHISKVEVKTISVTK